MRKVLIVITSGAVISEIIWQLYKLYRYQKGSNKNKCRKQLLHKDTEQIFEVTFYSKESALCRNHLASFKPCQKENCPIGYIKKIIEYLDSAQSTLDICMYFFTTSKLAEAVVRAKHRGVVVRIISDHSFLSHSGAQIMYFIKEGIRPMLKNLNVLMHHKFVIIDNEILINGSINWTNTAFFGNFENMIITNEPLILNPFVKEFEKLWTTFTNESGSDSVSE
ncbi:mitochondrial cardiolipin hydrolase [Pseudomyrmex gracilis]|uniref:mitochondrial cardiolipin hydrolase n=1 Tax=Pseudomyrmex gracilis TaxID=219809 RepID=UPI000994E5D0|nr:mitochondrial cardiolipin hydrolase [Pseudomyrmex gracilis]